VRVLRHYGDGVLYDDRGAPCVWKCSLNSIFYRSLGRGILAESVEVLLDSEPL